MTTKELSKTYDPVAVENKWYDYWMSKGFFAAKANTQKEPYTIVIPPPNVTGILHMGHMLNNTIQDVMIRRARMLGKEACWVPGTDHASIATEAKVVAMLREKGIKKSDLSRDEFLGHAWDWKEKYGGIILQQLKQLGASCDWDRTRFTMEPVMSEAVIEVFVKLYNDGLIYRGNRMVNWDPQGKTAVSDEEVIHKEVNSKLYYIKYPIAGSNAFITVATTRPETLFGDTAVCINPNDPRYQHLKGKKAIVPVVNREVNIIEDDYIDLEFGTGCLKVTPAHDINDYELGKKHGLEVIDVMNDDGTLNAVAGKYAGKDRFAVRKEVAKELESLGLLEKVEELRNSVGYSERTDAVIEPRLSLQWFVDMKKFMEKYPQVLDSVMNDEIKLYPPKFKNTYKHWIENIKDWCVSRQLWWGQRIPAYYLPDGQFVVAPTGTEALIAAKKLNPSISADQLKQDEDVLDTWFSSWLWPVSVFDGFKDPNNADIKYFYPTNDLVTAPEILFFWVARMIMAGYAFRGEKPFNNVYLTGIVRDKQGRKMSKSLGNSPEPLELIKKYGADGVRFGMLLSSPAGNDLLFDEKYCEQGRNFSNKIWNAFRLIQQWQPVNTPSSAADKATMAWFENTLPVALAEINEHFDKYRLSDALMAMYKLVWDDFCAWYLEMVKPAFGQPIAQETLTKTWSYFEQLLQIIHPFMPFISEELWQSAKSRSEQEALIIAPWPNASVKDAAILETGRKLTDAISQLRNIRNEKQLAKDQLTDIVLPVSAQKEFAPFEDILKKLAFVKDIHYSAEKNPASVSFLVGRDEWQVVLEGLIDPAKEKEKTQKEIEYLEGFLLSVEKKLSNERFVQSAPKQVLEVEQKKKDDALSKIQSLKDRLLQL
jgi:valyl-tRNA synthetase